MLLLFRIANTWKYCNRPKISIKLSKAIFLHLSNEVRQKRTDCFSMLVCYGVAVSDCEIHEKRKKWVCQHDPDLMRDLIDLRKFKPLRYCWGVNIDGIKSKQLFRLNGLVCVAYWSSWKRGYFCCQTKIFPSFFLKKKKGQKTVFFSKIKFLFNSLYHFEFCKRNAPAAICCDVQKSWSSGCKTNWFFFFASQSR